MFVEDQIINKLEFKKVLSFISKYSVTESGKEIIDSLKPKTDKKYIEYNGKLVTEAKNILIENENIPIEFLPNLTDILKKTTVEDSFITENEILQVLRLCEISRKFSNYFKLFSETAPNLLLETQKIYSNKSLENQIKNILTEKGEVKDSSSKELKSIREKIKSKEKELQNTVDRIIRSLKKKEIIQENFVSLRDGRVVLPIKAEHKRHVNGFIHSESATGQTVYIEPADTLELNNEIISLKFSERREIEKILIELTKEIALNKNDLISSFKTIAFIDSIFARARYSKEIKGCFPTFNNDKKYELLGARHPLLLNKLGHKNTVALNIKLDVNKIILITGPNAGGKTVVLKTIGLLSLLAQSGIHIPVSADTNLWMFDKIFIDIGDEQSIENDLSTFSSHLKNISKILKNVTEKSLVLLDEIGTGTDPYEGSALASATLISLQKKDVTVLATTHLGSLKVLANSYKGFENAAMQFDMEKLTPNYVFQQGIPGSSYALEIAKRIGFADDFFDLANENLESDKRKVEDLLIEIENKDNKISDKLNKIEIENIRLKGLSSLYDKNINKLKKEKQKILSDTKIESENYLSEMNKKIEHLIKELKETKADKTVIKETKKVLNSFKKKNDLEKNTDSNIIEIDSSPIEIGDSVKIKNTNTFGTLFKKNVDKNTATILSGGLRINTKLSSILKQNKKKDIFVNNNVYNYDFNNFKNKFDIRGERPEEIEFEVIKFVDEAYLSSQQKVEILHGKGTGVLKKMVKELLKKHDKVKSFYFAPIEQGGEGVTIVEIKEG